MIKLRWIALCAVLALAACSEQQQGQTGGDEPGGGSPAAPAAGTEPGGGSPASE